MLVGGRVPAAGVVLAVGRATAGLSAPLAAAGVSPRAERRMSPARGELADAALDLLTGAPKLVATGATGPRVEASRPSTSTSRRRAPSSPSW